MGKKIKIYRGVGTYSDEKLKEIIDDFKDLNSPFTDHGGGSILGSGSYFAFDRKSAEQYANNNGSHIHIFEYEVDEDLFQKIDPSKYSYEKDGSYYEWIKKQTSNLPKGKIGFIKPKDEYTDATAVLTNKKGFQAAIKAKTKPKLPKPKPLTELDRWQQELQRLSKLTKKRVNDDLFKAYQQMLRDIKGTTAKYLENYEKLSFSKRLEIEHQLKTAAQIEKIITDNYSDVSKSIKEYSEQMAKQGYNGVWYALEGAENIQLGLPILNQDYIEALVNRKIAGKTFSERLYRYRDRLAKETTNALLNGAAEGKGYKQIAARISELTEASYKQALRIAITEGGRTQSTATQKGYEESAKKGVNMTKMWMATLDKKTRKSHQQLDGQKIMVDSKFYYAGKFADGPRLFGDPGLDINCRCTTVPVVNGIAPELRRDNLNKKDVPFQSYNDWAQDKKPKKPKKRAKPSPKPTPKPKVEPSKKAKELVDQINMGRATHRDIINLGKAINAEYDVKGAVGDKERLVEIFSHFREMGGEVNKSVWAKGSRKASKERLAEAFSHYPKEWAEMLNNSGRQLSVGSTDRGFFAKALTNAQGYLRNNVEGAWTDYFTIYLSPRNNTVEYHEIGHLIENLNRDVKRIERTFVAARTKGEKDTLLRDLFPGYAYDADEVTKKDHFISPYIGKEYETRDTEVLSMGLESLFVKGNDKQLQSIVNGKRKYASILDDEEYLNLIIGLVAKG